MLESVLLSLAAGSATAIGGLIALRNRSLNPRITAFSLGFAGGVMVIVSFVSLLVEALSMVPYFSATVVFSLGAGLMILLDLSLPHMEFSAKERGIVDMKLFRSGTLIAIGISLHNLPEGLVISASYAHLPQLGIIIALAVLLHNIPEGVATALPLLAARVKPQRAIGLTLLSGLAEPLGSLLGATVLVGASPETVGSALAFAAGVMTYVTVDELIPVAHSYGHKHAVSLGLLLGIMFMMLLLNVLGY